MSSNMSSNDLTNTAIKIAAIAIDSATKPKPFKAEEFLQDMTFDKYKTSFNSGFFGPDTITSKDSNGNNFTYILKKGAEFDEDNENALNELLNQGMIEDIQVDLGDDSHNDYDIDFSKNDDGSVETKIVECLDDNQNQIVTTYYDDEDIVSRTTYDKEKNSYYIENADKNGNLVPDPLQSIGTGLISDCILGIVDKIAESIDTDS